MTTPSHPAVQPAPAADSNALASQPANGSLPASTRGDGRPDPRKKQKVNAAAFDKVMQDRETLLNFVLLVIRGMQQGAIKSKPLMITEPDAENYDFKSLQEVAMDALKKCGITLKGQSK